MTDADRDPPRPGGTPPVLQAEVRLRRGSFELAVALSVAQGEVLAVLGPNGSGKSTLLDVLAGLLAPDSGTVTVSGRPLTGPGVFVPPEHRRVGLMGQDPLLFPHLSATENIAFGPRSQGATRAAARACAAEWLDRLGLTGFGSRRPAELSGGQRQRVALARALAAQPALLLLDEPLAALDAQTAPEIRQVLRTYLRATGTTSILVTHDVLDAATLADRIVVLANGAVVDSGSATQVLGAPRSSFSAALAGLNLMPGDAVASTSVGGAAVVRAAGITISGRAAEPFAAGDAVAAVFPPSAVAVYLQPAGGSPRNSWAATVLALEPGPSAIRVRAGLDGAVGLVTVSTVAADLTAASVAELDLQPGSRVFLSVKATEVSIHRR